MFTRIESWLTLGNQYVAATVMYLGLAILLGGSTLLDSPQVLATSNEDCSYTIEELQEDQWVPVTYDGCPDGEQCCGGECISEDMICCEDGTYGDADTCVCDNCDCDDEPGEPCAVPPPTTIVCEEGSKR